MLFEILYNTSKYLLFIVTITAFLNFEKFGKTPLKYFVYYLFYLSIIEIVAFSIALSSMKYNIWWYNITLNGQYLFLFYFYFKLIKNENIKTVLIVLSIIYIIFFIYHYLIINDDWNKYQTYPFFVGNLMVIFSVFWYLIELFKSDEILYLKKSLPFWISLGLLFQFILIIPYDLISINFMKSEFINHPTVKLFTFVLYAANIIFYTLFLIGIWNTKASK